MTNDGGKLIPFRRPEPPLTEQQRTDIATLARFVRDLSPPLQFVHTHLDEFFDLLEKLGVVDPSDIDRASFLQPIEVLLRNNVVLIKELTKGAEES